MATTITNAVALADLIGFAQSMGYSNADALTRCKAHLASLEKSAAYRSSGPTKKQRANDAIIAKFIGHMRDTGEAFTTAGLAAWVSENVEECKECSVQKATSLLTRAVKLGFITRATDGKKVIFALVETEENED